MLGTCVPVATMELVSQPASPKSYHELNNVVFPPMGTKEEDVTNNNTIICSLSDQTNQVAGLTAAALGVVNYSQDHNISNVDGPQTSEEEDAITLAKLQDYLSKTDPTLMHHENPDPDRHAMSKVSQSSFSEDPQFKTLAPLVNVSLHQTPSPPSDMNSNSLASPNQHPISSPHTMSNSFGSIPHEDASDPSLGSSFDEDYKPIVIPEHSSVEAGPSTLQSTRGRKRKHKSLKSPRDSSEGSGPADGASRPKKDSVNRPPPHVLPPCKVCGIQATGFHYGVNTCEACKGFFRRSIIRKQPYVCAHNPVKCTIAPGKRNTCPACRYKKCVEAGMSVEGIKIGRYTYAKRTQDILELQVAKPEELEENNDSSDSNDGFFGESMTEMELVEFIQILVEANESKSQESLKNLDFVEQIQDQVKVAMGQRPSDSNIPMEEFLSVLSTTGVQLDDRFQILQQWIGVLNDGLRYVITFAKDIPGFKELSMSDQMALIKHSICEVWLISRHRAVHQDYDFFTTRTGLTLDIVKALGEDFGNAVVKLSRRLRKLELTIEETIILKAMAIFFTDRCEVEEPEKVTAIQNRLLEALLFLFSQRGVNLALTMGRLSSILSDLRHMTEFYQNYTKKLRIISSTTGVVDLPPLFLEIITFT